MACFADIKVSQASVATSARCGELFNIHLSSNLQRNLPVKNFLKSVKVWQNYSAAVGTEFLSPYPYPWGSRTHGRTAVCGPAVWVHPVRVVVVVRCRFINAVGRSVGLSQCDNLATCYSPLLNAATEQLRIGGTSLPQSLPRCTRPTAVCELTPSASSCLCHHPGADLEGGVTRVTSHPTPGAAAYFMLLICVWLK